MSYLKRQTLKLVLNRFKTSAEGWRSGESDTDAVQSLWQREGNYLSVRRTIQKRMEATLGSIIFPRDRNLRQLYVRSLCSQYVLISFSVCHYRASTIRFVGLFTLILRQHRAATETVALMIMSKVLFRCLKLLHNGFMLRFHFRLTFSTRYIVLGRAQTRCACFKPTLRSTGDLRLK